MVHTRVTITQPPWRNDKNTCTECGYVRDAISPTNDKPHRQRQPRGGDYNICMKCGDVTIFTGEEFNVRPPTDNELEVMKEDKELLEAVGRVKAFRLAGGWD